MIWNVRIEDTVCNRYPKYWQWCFVRCCNRLLYLSCFSYLTFNYSLHFIVHLIEIYFICYVLFDVVLSYIWFHFMIIVYLVFYRIRPFILSCFLHIFDFIRFYVFSCLLLFCSWFMLHSICALFYDMSRITSCFILFYILWACNLPSFQASNWGRRNARSD